MSKSKSLLQRAKAAVMRPFVAAEPEPEPAVVIASPAAEPVAVPAEAPPNAVLDVDGRQPVLVVLTPDQQRQFSIRVDGVPYTHVGEDPDGRWIYRPL